MQAFFEERIFEWQQRRAFQLAVEKEQEQAEKADHDAYFLQAGNSEAHFKPCWAVMGCSMFVTVFSGAVAFSSSSCMCCFGSVGGIMGVFICCRGLCRGTQGGSLM